MNKVSFCLFLVIVGITISCKEELERSKWQANPNGDSELALLMREMYDDAMMMKKDVMAKRVPQVRVKHEGILTAAATEPEKAGSQEYQDYARLYLQVVESIKKTNYKEAKGHYNSMVGMCLSCHDAICPGPKMKIDNLVIKEETNNLDKT